MQRQVLVDEEESERAAFETLGGFGRGTHSLLTTLLSRSHIGVVSVDHRV